MDLNFCKDGCYLNGRLRALRALRALWGLGDLRALRGLRTLGVGALRGEDENDGDEKGRARSNHAG